jgi:hypothetical protein
VQELLNSACSKVLVPVKIFQFQDMINENRFLGTFRGHSKQPVLADPSFEYKIVNKNSDRHLCMFRPSNTF